MTLTKIRENLYVPVDFEKNHNYYADEAGEKKYTGITSILGVLAKPALIPWAARMAVEHIDGFIQEVAVHADWQSMLEDGKWNEVMIAAKSAHSKKKEAAGEHGTDAHALVENFINRCLEINGGMAVDMGLEVDKPIEKFVEWAKENVHTFLFSERRMADHTLFIAGTADFAYVGKDGKKYMGDFKTSSGIYGIDYFLQVAAYRLLAESEGDAPYDGSAIVRLGKKGDFEAVYRFDYETDKRAFLSCLDIYRAQATFVKPKTTWQKSR